MKQAYIKLDENQDAVCFDFCTHCAIHVQRMLSSGDIVKFVSPEDTDVPKPDQKCDYCGKTLCLEI